MATPSTTYNTLTHNENNPFIQTSVQANSLEFAQDESQESDNDEECARIHVVPETSKGKQSGITKAIKFWIKHLDLFTISSMESHRRFGLFLQSNVFISPKAWLISHDASRIS